MTKRVNWHGSCSPFFDGKGARITKNSLMMPWLLLQ